MFLKTLIASGIINTARRLGIVTVVLARRYAEEHGGTVGGSRRYERNAANLVRMAGANSIFAGDKVLTAANAGDDKDAAMMAKMGLRAMEAEEPLRACKGLEVVGV